MPDNSWQCSNLQSPIIHQVYELWFKQILPELDNMEAMLADDKIMGMIRALGRIATIQRVLIQQIEILDRAELIEPVLEDRLDRAVDRAPRLAAPLRQVVRRRQAEHQRQLPRPPRRERAR